MSALTFSDLAAARCVPRRGPEHRLSSAAIAARLALLPGWTLAGDGQVLAKTCHFADYYHTLAFVNALAFIAHAQDHHPDLGVHYNRVEVRFSTHDVGGLSENDFICAAKVERLLAG